MPSPTVARERAAALAIASVGRRVRKVEGASARVALAVRIEIVVDVDGIDVIPLHDVEHDLHGAPPHRRLARIHPEIVTVSPDEQRLRAADMGARRIAERARITSAIRIEPGVQLDAAPVRLGDGEGERIPRRLGSASLPAR